MGKLLEMCKEVFKDIKEAKWLIKDVHRIEEERLELLKRTAVSKEDLRKEVEKN